MTSTPAASSVNLRNEHAVIRLAEVCKTFGEGRAAIAALDRVTFGIARHEFVSVLGPSGCGKSTLLRLIGGLVKVTRGSVTVFDHPITEPRNDVGIVFQRATLLPWLDVLGNVTFPPKHKFGRVTAQQRDRALELLGVVGLQEFADKRSHELSGGMQQRVALARALLLDPDILLMDEPFSSLDALTREEMSFELLQIWSSRPKTVLFITHSIPEAVLLSDRIIVMSPRPGTVREVLDVPLARPRSLASLSDPAFNELANHIRRQLFTRRAA